ncbi:30S ribosomal protein S11 [Candidatus Pacearchaeota archaeon]|nr:30S ribosomal protein S11 [Candidatus Pacearchaeota archaeon]
MTENKDEPKTDVDKEPKTEVKLEKETLEEKGIEVKVETPKVKKKKKESEAVVNIYTSFNNTIVHVTDMSGRTITKVTGGMTTKHGRLKANPTIAMFIAKRIDENIKDLGVRSLYFRIRAKTRNPAPGPGANAIIKSLSRAGYKILNILDTTRMPRGGPKKKGGRRGRRP